MCEWERTVCSKCDTVIGIGREDAGSYENQDSIELVGGLQ